MKIISLTAENVKKLRVVEIKPKGAIVQISGPNDSGKSSVLDSIFYALAGGKSLPGKPIRDGQESARIRLDLGELVVTRKFSGAGSTLTVEGANGARFPSPQKMLDDLIGAISFDPLAFSRMEARQQFDLLRRLVKIETDFDALAGLNKRDYDQRTEVNRQAKALQAQADGITVPADLPDAAIDTAALLAKMQSAGDANAARERALAEQRQTAQQIAAFRSNAAEKRERAVQLRRQADELDALAAKDLEQAMSLDLENELGVTAPEPIDTSAIRAEIDEANRINALVQQRQRKTEIVAEAEKLEQRSQELTDAIEARDAEKSRAIQAAKMPIPGLSLGDGMVVYGDTPFDQASTAQQIRVSVAIAMAANPKLRVLRIKEGSLLDAKNLELIRGMAEKGDYQVWIEQVDTTGKVGIVMEDGAVVAANDAGPSQQAVAGE